MPQRPVMPIASPETKTVFYDAATYRVLGSIEQRKEQANMARLIGTGKDPEGRYVKGQVVDSAGGSNEYQSLIDKGWCEPLPPESDPSRGEAQIAASVVRGDLLADPVDAALAAKYQPDAEGKIEVDPYEVVHEDKQPDSAGVDYSRGLGGSASTSPDHAVELSQSKLGKKELADAQKGSRISRTDADSGAAAKE